ncbi:hypothetical protein [Mycobacterium paraintracellulare]|uniref:hypothetical protein n=1 Tax=Mycobacterium paraintracellulare TaxID=1138383 RepID=UPI0019276A8B|nr:hypothetical protein [Mycobacterium paraintracellulare]BCP05634.1 hypothetical protein MINTM019_30900 [Mycobacterium paraintracellulare]
MAVVTGQQVADFLGGGGDTNLVALAGQHAAVITALASGYTRGEGFTDGVPKDDIAAVIVTATARLVANPQQLGTDVGNVSIRGGFQGFNLAELFVLNRYRKRAE